jgi:hypothetical protein
MKKQKVSKAQCQRYHAKKRALERFDISLTTADLDKVVQTIQEGNAAFITKQSHRISVFSILINEKKMNVVYDKVRKTIVTFLTDDMIATFHETLDTE